jgi:hypothetical protein
MYQLIVLIKRDEALYLLFLRALSLVRSLISLFPRTLIFLFNTVDAVFATSKKTAIQQAHGLDDASELSERIDNNDETYKIFERVK